MKIFLTNSYSLGMLEVLNADIKVRVVTIEEVREILAKGFTSAVGHQSTASIFAGILGMEVPFNRATIATADDDVLIIGQYTGPRLDEGAKVLPDGAKITWVKVVVTYS